MTPFNWLLCTLAFAAAIWPKQTLNCIAMLDLELRLFWLDCRIAWVTFWLILKLRRSGLNVPLNWSTIWPGGDSMEE